MNLLGLWHKLFYKKPKEEYKYKKLIDNLDMSIIMYNKIKTRYPNLNYINGILDNILKTDLINDFIQCDTISNQKLLEYYAFEFINNEKEIYDLINKLEEVITKINHIKTQDNKIVVSTNIRKIEPHIINIESILEQL